MSYSPASTQEKVADNRGLMPDGWLVATVACSAYTTVETY